MIQNEWMTLLVVYGPMGVVLAWFMWRMERLLRRFTRAVNLMAIAIIRQLEKDDPSAASELSKQLYHINGDGDETT